MISLEQLNEYLINNNADFKLIHQTTPIISVEDAAKYYDIKKAAPTFIMQTENGLIAILVSSQRGKLDLKSIKKQFNFTKLKFADKKIIEEKTGYEIGLIPLVGHNLPCIFDKLLLNNDYVYGGTGDPLTTLQIKPTDLEKSNQIMGYLL